MTRRYVAPPVSLHKSECSSSETLPLYEESVSPPSPPAYDQSESLKSAPGSTGCTKESVHHAKQHCFVNDEKRDSSTAGEGSAGGIFRAIHHGHINIAMSARGRTPVFEGRSSIASGPSTQGRTAITTGGRSEAKRIMNDQAHCGHSPYGRLIGEPVVGDSMSGDVFDGTTMSGDTVKGKTMSGNTLYGKTMSGDTVWGSTVSGRTLLPGKLTVMGVTKWPID